MKQHKYSKLKILYDSLYTFSRAPLRKILYSNVQLNHKITFCKPTPHLSSLVSGIVRLICDLYIVSQLSHKVYVKNASGAPVFFWIHGGGFTSGSGNQYAATELVKKNIVVVTFNYRLGSLGK